MSFANLPVLRHGLMLRHEGIIPELAFHQRWSKVRDMMKKQQVNSLLVYGDSIYDGPVCYLTNYPCYSVIRQAIAVLSLEEGPFLYTSEPGRNLPKVQNFICCQLEKEQPFFQAACKQAQKLAGNGFVGLVGKQKMLASLAKGLEDNLGTSKIKDLTAEFHNIMALKDESELEAVRQATELANKGLKYFADIAVTGKSLHQLQAEVDYYLRTAGCENTNILIGAALSGYARPGITEKNRNLRHGESVQVYVGAQFARQWGSAGATIIAGNSGAYYSSRIENLKELKNNLVSKITPGISLSSFHELVVKTAEADGIKLALDLPLAQGIGYDMLEYPLSNEDQVEDNTILQVTLAMDLENEGTNMVVDLLQINSQGNVWFGA